MPHPADMVLALPIKGESFLLRRAGFVVLVDGGWATDNIADIVVRHVRDVTHFDIVLCTHGDADHAGGLPALLNRWSGRVRQVWLPGRWVEVIPQLARDPSEFLTRLLRELDTEPQQHSDDVYQAMRGNDYEMSGVSAKLASVSGKESDTSEFERFEERSLGQDFAKPPEEPDWFTALRHAADQLAGDLSAGRAFATARRSVLRRRQRWTNTPRRDVAHYWLQLIDTAKAIRGIAIAAIRHHIPTRWFDSEGFAQSGTAIGGERGFLVPINSIEQVPPPKVDFLYRQLTRINKESLVFLAPPAHRRLAVLFCADSPLGDGQHSARSFLPEICQHWFIVATAPHHGSESNRIAYTHLREWANVAVLLRAGGTSKQPGQTWFEQDRCLRLCAKCPKVGNEPLLTGVVGWGCYGERTMALGRRCDCTPISTV